MPRVYNPSPPNAGPGSAFAGTGLGKKRNRRRRKVRSHSPPRSSSKNDTPVETSEQPFIGQELLDWHDENESPKGSVVSTSKSSCEKVLTQEEESLPHCAGTAAVSNTVSSDAFKSRRALCIDTRFVDTSSSIATAENVVKDCGDLVRSLITRGVTPFLLASTCNNNDDSTNKSKSNKKSRPIRVQVGSVNVKKYLSGRKTFFVAKVPAETSDADNNAVHIPKELSAAYSWKVFGTMVSTIVAEDAKLGSSSKLPPLDITILTNDVSLFCDTDTKVHEKGVDRFWKTVAPLFQDSKVGKIQIVVATTGTVVTMNDPDKPKDDRDDPEAMDVDVYDVMDASFEETELIRDQELVVATCVRTIQTQLRLRAQEDFCKNQSHIAAGEAPVDISLSTIGNGTIAYQALSRQWVRESLLGRSMRGNLELELPETVDGTQCAVSLDVSYQVFPCMVDSSETIKLATDLKLLSASKMKLVQLVPLDSIDASLLFGIPMLVRTQLASDLDQFEVMQVLTRSLFSVLAERQSAMLLCPEDKITGNGEESGLFHSAEQTFVLMAKESSKTSSGAPNSGLLYRYAHADQLLAEAVSPTSQVLLDEETQQQYSNYVEQALECLECSPINPLYGDDADSFPDLPAMPKAASRGNTDVVVSKSAAKAVSSPKVPANPEPESVEPSSPAASPSSRKKTHADSPGSAASVWNDAAGVGSRRKPAVHEGHASQDSQDSSEVDFSAFDE